MKLLSRLQNTVVQRTTKEKVLYISPTYTRRYFKLSFVKKNLSLGFHRYKTGRGTHTTEVTTMLYFGFGYLVHTCEYFDLMKYIIAVGRATPR